MDLTNPIRSVIPAVQGDVLAVLARTDTGLSGRGIAALAEGVSPAGVNLALRALVVAGLVEAESHPPAKLYRLNRRHLAADAIVQLATIRQRMIVAMQEEIASWDPFPWGVWLFGSAARGDGASTSDIDVLVVRPDAVDDDDTRWLDQLDQFVRNVGGWTGNRCSIVEYSVSEFEELRDGGQRFVTEVQADAIALTSRRFPRRAAVRGPS